MRITVQYRRGQQLPWPVAVAFVILGAAMVVAGFAIGPIDMPGGSTGAIPMWLALALLVPIWLLFARWLLRSSRARRRLVAAADVPERLDEPPDREPAVAAVVIGRGRVPAVAVASTVLRLARRGWIDLYEVGERVIVSFAPDATDDGSATAGDHLVLRALAERRAPETGDVSGPPCFGPTDGWWPAYTRDATSRAVGEGLLEPRLPFVGLMLASVVTATVVALAIFWYTLAFVGLILLANGIPHLLARAGGYRLSAAGTIERARWLAFARGLRERPSLAAVGPAGVVMWGPYLVAGVLVGAAPRAAAALTPDVGRRTALPDDVSVITQVITL